MAAAGGRLKGLSIYLAHVTLSSVADMGGTFLMDRRWAHSPLRRDQLALFSRSVDESVPGDHPVRAFEACLDLVDWGPWEARYARGAGQPPIHPKQMASAILYGLILNLRSSRMLEDATRNRVDFMWLLEGRTIDHATFAAFRTAFGEELRGLNRAVCRAVCTRFKGSLATLILDGTRVRANSDRFGAKTAETLERLAAACADELNRKLERLGEEDERVEQNSAVVEALETEAAKLRAELDKYKHALAVAHERDAEKKRKDGAGARAVRVPVTDPAAHIVPNKDGGFAPNYTPVAAVDEATGLIVAADVLDGSDEASAVQPAVAEAQALCGQAPERVLADSGFAAGETLRALDAMEVDAYMPTTADAPEDNPAHRQDPSTPVPEHDVARLPLRGQQYAASAFLYDAQADCYYCPMGKTLRAVRTGRTKKTGVCYTQYQCPGKAGCPLATRCVQARAHARTIQRDEYQPLREQTARRMATPEGRAIYRARAPVVEGVFAHLKHHMNIRRFETRGLHNVRNEWAWICTAYNLKKMMRLLPLMRPQGPDQPPRRAPNAFRNPTHPPKLLPLAA